MTRPSSPDLTGATHLPVPDDQEIHPDHGLTDRRAHSHGLVVSALERVHQSDAGTGDDAHHTRAHRVSALASVHAGHPTHTRGTPPRSRYPLPDHPAWRAFKDGYLAGITHGIGMGRAQVSQEVADAATFPTETPRTASHEATLWAADGLSRAEWIARRQAERDAARTEYHGSSLTGEQIRENAFRSWGLIDIARWNAA